MRPVVLLGLRTAFLVATLVCAGAVGPASAQDTFDVFFSARFMPSQGQAEVSIRVSQSEPLLKKLEFPIDPERFFRFQGDGEVTTAENTVLWEVPEKGGRLRYSVHIDHLRETSEYDARLAHDWALLRGSDLFPPGTSTTKKGATSRSTLRLRLPPKWRALVPFEADEDGGFLIAREGSRYDRPAGWMLLGEKLDVRTATIAEMNVRIAGPAAHDVRTRDLMALLRWTVPSLGEAIGELPGSLLIVSAGDPMWRGGLSGPHSLYLHADRPLIEEDGTSPVLHELIHVVMSANAGPQGDWIIEGLAEYYSLELLRRSGTVSDKDHAATLARMKRKAAPIGRLGTGEAGAAETARGVLIMRDLDQAIREGSDGKRSLDDVLRLLQSRRGRLDRDGFVAALQRVGGSNFAPLLPPAVDR